MQEKMTQQAQYGAFDYLKLVLAFLVIAIHVNPFTSFGGLYGDFNMYFSRVLSRFAVPMFFMMSGFFFFSHFPEEGFIRVRATCIFGYVKRILILWGSWFIVLFPMSYYLNVIKGDLTFWDLFEKFVFRGGYTVAWYFMASIHGVIVIALLKKLRSDAVLLVVSVVLMLFCLGSSTYFKVLPVSLSKMMLSYISSVFDPCFSFPLAVAFMGVGAWFSRHPLSAMRLSPLVLWGSVLVSFALYGVEAVLLNEVYDVARRKVFDNNLYFSILPAAICVFIVMLRQNVPANRHVRNLSTLVFLSHMVFVVAMDRIVFYTTGSCNSLLKYFLVIGCSVATGMCILYVERRFEWKWIRCLY